MRQLLVRTGTEVVGEWEID